MIVLIPTGIFSVSIEKTKFAWVFSILTTNFPVRIDKKIVCIIVLNLTEIFPVNIKKVETN